MRVLLVSANTEAFQMLSLPLGLACVAAATRKAGHEVAVLDLMFEGNPQAAIRKLVADFRPDVIGISVRNIDNQDRANPQFLLPAVRAVVRTCRAASHAPLVVGGAGYSIFPHAALRYLGADVGIQGEGEMAFPALLEQMTEGKAIGGLPGVCLPDGAMAEMKPVRPWDDFPLPEPDLWVSHAADRENLWVPVQSRRGCPMQCSYCSTHLIQGKTRRTRPAEQVVAWLAELRAAGYRNFAFVDNNFNLPLAYAKDLCRRIIASGLDVNLWCIVYPKWMDTELVELMREAGCREVALGFESGSAPILGSFNKRFTADEVRAVARLFEAAGIHRRGFLMLGAPGETKATVEESLAFADSLNLDALKITLGIRIYPHTALARTAMQEKLIQPDDDLLFPRFYFAPSLRDWLPERVVAYASSRPWAQ
jgi:radical SAM superfamily enzyme YgiQ (UPF0313 family)